MRTMNLNIPNKVPQAALEGPGDLCNGFNRRFLLATFDVADVIAREIGLFREFLLAEAGLFSGGTDGLAQRFINSARRMHHSESKQKRETELPTNGWYFLRLAFGQTVASNGLQKNAGSFRNTIRRS
jgi:hypothetical protein